MPSKTPKQARLMGAVAHNPAFAKAVGIPQSVGKEFAKEDKRRRPRTRPEAQKINRKQTARGQMKLF